LPSLSIKKVYFDAILQGTKRHEYRAATPFYDALFKSKPRELLLHYYRPHVMRVQVVKIRKIRTSKRLHSLGLGFPPHVYEIEVRNPKIIRDDR
jgi:hypothetical protein